MIFKGSEKSDGKISIDKNGFKILLRMLLYELFFLVTWFAEVIEDHLE